MLLDRIRDSHGRANPMSATHAHSESVLQRESPITWTPSATGLPSRTNERRTFRSCPITSTAGLIGSDRPGSIQAGQPGTVIAAAVHAVFSRNA